MRRALLISMLFLGGCEEMSGDLIGRYRLAHRAKQSTEDIAELKGKVSALEKKVADLEQKCGVTK